MDKIENNYYRVAIYLRLSDEDRDKLNKLDDSESIKNQRNLLLEEIRKRPDFLLVDEYSDEDLSGAGTFRPEFERLIKDCENGKIDVILCKSQSRFSRDMEVIEKYIHNKFIEWNIRFIGLTDNADTDDPGNKKSRQINGLVNEWYLEDTSNNIRGAFRAKMNQGEFISPFAAFGYEVSLEDNNKLTVDPVASLIVKDIFLLYLKGMGFTGIAKYLNKRNIPSPSFYKYQKGIKLNVVSNRPREEIKWNTNAIKTILTNELYLGHLIQGKRTTVSYKNHKIIRKNQSDWIRRENTHDAIIDEDMFNKVQIAIGNRTKSMKKTGIVHNFSGKVFCLECRRYMRKKNSKLHEYLVCSNNMDGYDNCINKSSIRYDVLENIVLDLINEKIKDYYDEEVLNKFKTNGNRSIFNDKIKQLENQKVEILKKISEIKKYIKLLYEDRVNGIISLERFKELINDYEHSESVYNEQIDSIDNEIEFYKNKDECFKDKVFNSYKSLKSLNRFIIDEFIKKIYVGKLNRDNNTRDIKIEWNFLK